MIASADSPERAYRLAADAEQATVAEMERLQAVFTVYDPESELCRWRSGRAQAGPELAQVLAAAEYWWRVSGGAFHPASGELRRRWLQAEAEQEIPSPAEVAEIAQGLADLPLRVESGQVRVLADCSGVDLNAIAKGYIVDRGVRAAARREGVLDVLVNAGGDLRHTGPESVRVGVENPDAVGGPPLRVLNLGEGAIATSGSVHRGFRIAGDWFGHVIDPRTGWPVPERPSTTVQAVDAMTADALATVVGVLDWAQASEIIQARPGAAALASLRGGRTLVAGDFDQTV